MNNADANADWDWESPVDGGINFPLESLQVELNIAENPGQGNTEVG